MKHKIVLAITGASGAIYAKILLDRLWLLKDQIESAGVIISDNAKTIWKQELNEEFTQTSFCKGKKSSLFTLYKKNDFNAAFASGSASYNIMIVCPCSMGTLGRIAAGISDDLVTRAADVILKERRKLILVTREAPLNLIHINNMKTITEAGGIICPASPSFYTQPRSVETLSSTVVERVIDLSGLTQQAYRWHEYPSKKNK